MALQTDLSAAHARALKQAHAVIAGIRADQLTSPTPCSKWNTRELANHLVGVNWMMSAAGKGEKVEREGAPPDLLGDDPAGAYDASSRAAAEAFGSPGALERPWVLPFGEVPGEVARNIHLMDTVTHTWDLAKASGQTEQLDPELGEVAYGLAAGIVRPESRNDEGNPFAPVVTVSEGAPVYDRLAGFLGRRP
jgi:uncharacterized protein (TIGR03086 family)